MAEPAGQPSADRIQAATVPANRAEGAAVPANDAEGAAVAADRAEGGAVPVDRAEGAGVPAGSAEGVPADGGRALEALGDANRRAIVEILGSGALSVQQIAERLPISRPAVSRHLRLLKEAGLVDDEPDGTRRVYQLRAAGVEAIRDYFAEVWGAASTRFRIVAENTQPRDPRDAGRSDPREARLRGPHDAGRGDPPSSGGGGA